MRRRNFIVFLVVAAGGLAWAIAARLADDATGAGGPRAQSAAAVEVAPVERGPIELRRTFAGTLEARGRSVVAAHVGGRVERLLVDLADTVEQGQVVAELDDQEQAQGVAEAAAELAAARASVADAEAALQIAQRELDRLESLERQGVVSTSDLDTARSAHLARDTGVKVARAQLARAQAAHQRARIRSGYARVIASWSGEEGARVVAQRHVDAGDTVGASDPLFTVVSLTPLTAVVHVTERDYSRLVAGQSASIRTDAYPQRAFEGIIRRIAPAFRESSRQARVELEMPNPERLLKPGMFVRAEVVLSRVDDATIVPLTAVVTRGGVTGVFVVDEAGEHVLWRPVTVGIREGDRVQVTGEGVEGRVVTLGQQLIDDGSAIRIPNREPATAGREGS